MSEPAANVTLVLGGARSGKSAVAERIASATRTPVLYVATAEVGDDEMAARVERHRARRPPSWRTLDAPHALPSALTKAVAAHETVLIDSIDGWLANELLRAVGVVEGDVLPRALAAEVERTLLDAVADLAGWAAAHSGAVVLVSSEVGAGVVPPYPLGRLYRDVLGAANQALAAASGRVLFVVAGIAVDLRALAARTDLP